MAEDLEVFLMTEQPPTCPRCVARVVIIKGAETCKQVVRCFPCNFQYRLEADEDDV